MTADPDAYAETGIAAVDGEQIAPELVMLPEKDATVRAPPVSAVPPTQTPLPALAAMAPELLMPPVNAETVIAAPLNIAEPPT